jgi:alpha-ketoglutarate-dependent taurine dioxygenase
VSRNGPQALDVRPAAGHIGAQVEGVDLAGPLEAGTVEGIRAALQQWKVLFFRDQRLDHAGQTALARRFGDPVPPQSRGSSSPADFPFIETTADRKELAGRYGQERADWLDRRRHSALRGWHSDLTARIDPPAATILRAEDVPAYGGDTTWSNLAAAYAGMSEPLRRFADGLWAEHRHGVGYLALPGSDPYLQKLQEHPVVSVHPLVRVHPQTGERLLFVNGYYVERIVGVSRIESRPLMELFLEQATRPEYTVRFRWEPGSVAFWDNRATIHLAPADTEHLQAPRIMHRVLLAGEVPVGVDGRPSQAVAGAPLGAGPAAVAGPTRSGAACDRR